MDGPFFMDTRRLYTPPVVYRSVRYCPAAYPLPARTRRSRTLFRLTPRTFHPLFPMYNVKWTSRGLKRPSNVVESGFRGFGTRVWDGEIGSCYPVRPVRNSQAGQEQPSRSGTGSSYFGVYVPCGCDFHFPPAGGRWRAVPEGGHRRADAGIPLPPRGGVATSATGRTTYIDICVSMPAIPKISGLVRD